MADIGNIVRRLEDVAARLERFEVNIQGNRAGSVPDAAGAAAAPSAAPQPTLHNVESSGAQEAAYQTLLSESLQPLLLAAADIGGEVQQATAHIQRAFNEQGIIIELAARAQQPDTQQLQALLQPVVSAMMAASSMTEQRRSPAFQQCKVVAEVLQSLSWLAYTGPSCGNSAVAQHIGECWQAAEFYANKLLMEFRSKDETQVTWVRSLKDLTMALQAYVRTHHPGGLKWSPTGTSIEQAQLQLKAAGSSSSTIAPTAAAARPKATGAPPAAPPPPPPGLLLQERPAKGSAGSGAGAAAGGGAMQDLFKELSKGSAVTSGLRKVTDDMKAKNRAEKSGHVPAAPSTAGNSAAGSKPAPRTGPPRVSLEQDAKWIVENQTAGASIVLDKAQPKHAVYIYNCSDCVVQITGKVKTVGVDKCRKVGVVFNDVIAACEVVNCTSVQVQCTSTVPIVSVDKCDGCQVFLPAHITAAGVDFQLVTAKSSEVNVTVVAANPETDDSVEHAVPEQFISKFGADGRLQTVVAAHSG